MNQLRQLIGKTVTVQMDEDESGFTNYVRCKVIDVYVDDYYFEEKGEPMSVKFNVEPVEDMGEDFEWESCYDVYLDRITK
tara:strand:+ start:429 stop:668 length:240 start_codon:yes stop_codon:yes gene_type:complete